MKRSFIVILQPIENHPTAYTATVPEFGSFVGGQSREEVLKNASRMIKALLLAGIKPAEVAYVYTEDAHIT